MKADSTQPIHKSLLDVNTEHCDWVGRQQTQLNEYKNRSNLI